MAKTKPLLSHFPMYPSDDYDMCFPDMHHPIGINSTAPPELIKRIVAAAISYQLQNKGIDYTYKTYLRDAQYDTNDGSRVDIRISRAIADHHRNFSSLLYQVTTSENKILGNMICEWTLIRAPHSIRQLLTLANRGNLYECCAVGRMVLEQIAWAAAIDNLMDPSAIKAQKAEGSIRALKNLVPFAGVFYGWLSSHTHWRYDDHIKSMTFGDEGMAATLQSSKFKAVSLCVALLLTSAVTLVLRAHRQSEISTLMTSPPETRLVAGKKIGGIVDPWVQLFGPPTISVADIEKMLTLSEPLNLLKETLELVEADKDIALLSAMTAGLDRLVANF